ncbi:MAG: efflux RND transporter periplasmic adaptor subunit [Epsilonproteobacteria bacterium]|nr:efflux RND transporter periplasmic adaptor subunit [Campylobacterota bacterium]
MKIVWIMLTALMLDAQTTQVKQLFNYSSVTVKKVDFSESKTFYAKTALDESRIKEVTLRYDAFVNRLYTDTLYSKVTIGDPLFNLYAKEVSALHQEYLISKSLSKRAKKNAQLKLKLLEVEALVKKQKPVYNFDLKSPYSGYVIEKNILEGGFIKKGESILKIADFSKLWVVAKVYQKDISFVSLGMQTEVIIEGFLPIQGVVDFIYPRIDPKDQSVSVRIVIDNPKLAYYPDLFAKVVLKKRSTSMLVLPKTAVLTKEDRHYVFVPSGKEGEFEPQEINAKRVNSNTYQIISGLDEEDSVVDNALFMLDSDAVTNALYESDDDDDW